MPPPSSAARSSYVAIIILGAVGAFLFVYLGTGSVLVTSNSQFIPAGSSTSFTATVTPPSFVSVNSILVI